MREIRNNDGRLVCKIDERTGAIEISLKGCVTLITHSKNGEVNVVHNARTA